MNDHVHPLYVLATANPHKVEELRALLEGSGVALISATDAGFTDDIEETGTTLEANALLKARRLRSETDLPSIADDTGLEVDALHGAPGVYSARYAGPQCSPQDNRALLLHTMRGTPMESRTARFCCVLALVDDAGEHLFEGEIRGRIALEERGTGGFGYDAVFCPDGDTRTLAEYSPAEKNAISHRGRAARKLKEYLIRYRQ